jgi:hypothetical protein
MTHTTYQTDRTRYHLQVMSIPYQSSVWMTSHHCHKVRTITFFVPHVGLTTTTKATETRYPSLLRDFATVVTSEPFVVDKNGEMPEVAIEPSSLNPPIRTHSINASSGVLSSSSAYVMDEQIPRTGTPEPIKVKRTKKKKVLSAKSRRADAE